MSLPFSEWSREAKDEFARKRMEEMKLKNEALKQRYAEVEQDRIKAEAKDSAVTSLKASKKENVVIEREKVEDTPKVIKEREWDREKIDQDADDWSPPKFHGYRSRPQRRNFPDRRAPKKEENWRVRPANASKDRQSYSKFRSSGPNQKYQESSNYGTSGFRNENAGFSRQRGRAHRTSSGTYRSFQNSRFDEPRKTISGVAGSASPSLSDSEMEPVKQQPKPETARMWQDGGVTVQHKQSRVEKWVKSINTAGAWDEEYNNVKGNDYYPEKRGEAGPRDAAKSYGYSNEEGYSKKSQSSRDQTHLKNRERYDGSKYGQSSRGNSRARGSRTPTGERTVGGFENKNQRDFRKRNYSDKNRFRRESDLSDRTSSMKESDYHEFSKDKFNKTTSDSKSSDYSGIWEDEECEFKYVSENRPFDKQSGAHNYGNDKFNQPKNVRTSSVSSGQDGMQKDCLDDEYAQQNTCQKFPNSYIKDKSKTKNLRNSDQSGFGDQYVDNRSGARKVDYSFSKVKSNKYKTEPKFSGHSGKFENESAADNYSRASRKYKMGKPSPKRTLSNPVKSVDTSSSASKTMEFNSPDEDIWGDYEDTSLPWTIERNNDGHTELKSNPFEEEACVNKVSQPLDPGTPVKTDCDASSEKVFHQNFEFQNAEVDGNAVSVVHHDGIVEQNIEIIEKVVLSNLESSFDKSGTEEDSTGLTEGQKLQPNDLVNDEDSYNIESASSPNKTSGVQKTDAEIDSSGVNVHKHEESDDSGEYSGDESEIKVLQPISDVITTTTFDSIESKNPKEIVTTESKSFPEVSEEQNSQDKSVQSTETEQTSTELPNNANQEHFDKEVAEKDIGAEDSSSNNAEYGTEETIKDPAENDKTEIVLEEIKASSSQSMDAACSKDDSESALKSSGLVTSESQSPKREGNENSSGALNLSDDGGWSTVSEDENNMSEDDKNNQEGTSATEPDLIE